nr:MAG TPA: hypothetical protein [Caudoviricetes sp.]
MRAHILSTFMRTFPSGMMPATVYLITLTLY